MYNDDDNNYLGACGRICDRSSSTWQVESLQNIAVVYFIVEITIRNSLPVD